MSSKAEFIRSLPLETPASEVVSMAEKEGLENVTAAYVYAIRSSMKKTRPQAAGKGSPPVRLVKTSSAPPLYGNGRADHRKALTVAVLDLGVHGVEELLGEIREKLAEATR